MRKLSLEELGRKSIDEFRSGAKTPIIVVLDNIRSAMNVGSFFRTADAFAIEKIYLCGITAKPPHREITKTAIGATHSVDWEYKEDILVLLDELKSEGKKLIGIEQTNESIPLIDLKVGSDDYLVVIFGNEVEGLKESLLPMLDIAVEIPQFGTKHSLNVAVCGGIVLYDIHTKLRP